MLLGNLNINLEYPWNAKEVEIAEEMDNRGLVSSRVISASATIERCSAAGSGDSVPRAGKPGARDGYAVKMIPS